LDEKNKHEPGHAYCESNKKNACSRLYRLARFMLTIKASMVAGPHKAIFCRLKNDYVSRKLNQLKILA
jgi:hypothetical protein